MLEKLLNLFIIFEIKKTFQLKVLQGGEGGGAGDFLSKIIKALKRICRLI